MSDSVSDVFSHIHYVHDKNVDLSTVKFWFWKFWANFHSYV